jgi:hypothetical protein
MKPETNRMAGALPSPRKAPDVTPRLLQLLDILLSDVDTDIGVAARDLGIADASLVRLQRARDRLICVQGLLEEAMPAVTAGVTAGRSHTDGDVETGVRPIAAAMREAVGLLAREWPQDYPAGAVEWLVAAKAECNWRKERTVEPAAPGCDSGHGAGTLAPKI